MKKMVPSLVRYVIEITVEEIAQAADASVRGRLATGFSPVLDEAF